MLALAYEHPRSKQTVQIRQAVGIARDQPFKLRIGEQALLICLGVTPSGGSEGNINALAPPPLRPVPRPSRLQPRTPPPCWSRRAVEPT